MTPNDGQQKICKMFLDYKKTDEKERKKRRQSSIQ